VLEERDEFASFFRVVSGIGDDTIGTDRVGKPFRRLHIVVEDQEAEGSRHSGCTLRYGWSIAYKGMIPV
jgi:hypothetical protein